MEEKSSLPIDFDMISIFFCRLIRHISFFVLYVIHFEKNA